MKRLIALIMLVVSIFSINCKKDKKDDKSILLLFLGLLSPGGKVTFQIKNASNTTSTNILAQTERAIIAGPISGDTESKLESLKYYFTNVSICKNIVRTGGTSANFTDCIILYSNWAQSSIYNSYDGNMAEQDTTNYLDMFDPNITSLLAAGGKLGSSTSSSSSESPGASYDASKVGKYNYVSINFFQPIKFKAKLKLGDSATTLYTRKGTYSKDQFGNYVTTASSLISPTTSEEAIVRFGNGLTYFKLSEPLEITSQDVTDKKELRIALTFNPDHFVKGWKGSGSNFGTKLLTDSAGNSLQIPMVNFVPVVYKSEETVKKESYLVDITRVKQGTEIPNNIRFQMRIELYFSSSSPDRVLGIEMTPILTANTYSDLSSSSSYESLLYLYGTFKPGGVTKNSDESLTLKDDMDNEIFTNFKRLTTEGSSSTQVSGMNFIMYDWVESTKSRQKNTSYIFQIVSYKLDKIKSI